MKISKLILVFSYLIAIAVSIKSFREPDLWWQIRTGEWILENHEVPKQDVFSYTMSGTEWINIKWGFEVVAAFIANLLGAESVFILQTLVNCFLVFFLFKFSKLFIIQKVKEEELKNSHSYLFSGAVAFLVLVIASEYRMIGRPEMISHLFTVMFLYLLEQNRRSPSRLMYLLIPLQLLWSNLHEAFGIGLVVLLIYTGSSWIQWFLSKGKKAEAVRLSLVSFAAIASVLVNPNGIKLLTRPFNIMSQVYSNKYTTELLDFTASGWWKKEAYLGLLIFTLCIISIVFVTRNGKKKGSSDGSIITRLNDPYLITILAFLYLGLTAYRNLILLTLVCFPAFHYALFLLSKKLFVKSRLLEKYSAGFALLLLIAFYAGIVSDQYYKLTDSRDRFGLEVLSVNNPTGAADFIRENNLVGKKCFSDYLTSSYLLWKLQPEFKTYIDLRDLDVFPPEFFNSFLLDVNSPLYFHRRDSAQQFKYAVLFRPQFDALHAYLYNDSIYALKYVDAVAAVYEKTDDFSREDIFSSCKPVKTSAFAMILNKILNPFYSSYDYSIVEENYIAGNYYLNVHRFDLVMPRANALIQEKKSDKGNELIAQVYFRSSLREPGDSAKSALLASAEDAYRKSLRHTENYAPSLLGLGIVHMAQKNYMAAIKDLSGCLDQDKNNYQAHLAIAQCYRELMNITTSRKDEYRESMLRHFLDANSLNPGNPMVLANIGFVYFQMHDCDRATEFLSRVSGNQSLSKEDQLAVQNCLRQCGS